MSRFWIAFSVPSASESNELARLVNVKVNPKARINKVEDDGEGGYIIWTTEPPDKGAANRAVTKALARHLGISRSSVALVRGETSRRKLFEILD